MNALVLPLPQSPEYAAACAALGIPVRACKRSRDGDVSLWWQIQSRRLGVLGRVDLVSRGPVARDPGDQDRWLGAWQRWHDGRPMLLNADGIAAANLRAAGFWPLMTPATVGLVRLGPRAEMRARLRQKWRNRLNRAEAAGLRVTRHPLSAQHWLLDAELHQARAKGYRGLTPALSLAYARANPRRAWVFEARHRARPVAGLLVLQHGPMATWQIGVSLDEGRALNAMNLLLWQAMGWLADEGHSVLDLGLMNADDAAGMTRFKLGTGAAPRTLGGTWLHLGALAPVARHLPLRLAG